MTTATVPSFTATIWLGTKNRDAGLLVPEGDILKSIQEYVDRVGLCVSVTPTTFIYTNGCEPGFAIGLINYPRFPAEPSAIREKALELAWLLKDVAQQYKVSVVFPDVTEMNSTEPE